MTQKISKKQENANRRHSPEDKSCSLSSTISSSSGWELPVSQDTGKGFQHLNSKLLHRNAARSTNTRKDCLQKYLLALREMYLFGWAKGPMITEQLLNVKPCAMGSKVTVKNSKVLFTRTRILVWGQITDQL